LIVGANAAGSETLEYLRGLELEGAIDRLLVSTMNLHKAPMMRRMLMGVDTRLIWWFDDDSYVVEDGAMGEWLKRVKAAPPTTVLWGQGAECGEPADFTTLDDVPAFVRSAEWYRGLPLPSWRPGGKGEFNFAGRGTGDGRWIFVLGGCWMIRARTIRALDWPDRRLVRLGDDVLLGEAIRQRGWSIENIGAPGVRLDTEPRRGA
jgi:GT2 family glycosyltransferase